MISHSLKTSLLLSTRRAFRAITLNYKQVTMKYNLRPWLCSHLIQHSGKLRQNCGARGFVQT